MSTRHVIVIGAGAGGLSAAIHLASAGLRVTVLERADQVGGKLTQTGVGDVAIDAGPTVLTMRWVLEALFATAGATLTDWLTLDPAEILARHAWSDSERLDLFATVEQSADAIGVFAGAAEAQGYRRFIARAARAFHTLDATFMRAPRPTALTLTSRVGLAGLPGLWSAAPFSTLWQMLGEHFRDPRLRQLFGRYATYSGSSPFLAPATLMLIAHVEQSGVWFVRGGMVRLATALASLAVRQGATVTTGTSVEEILVKGGRTAGVRLANGEQIPADAVILNADSRALDAGLFGPAVSRAVSAAPPARRSLSAVTWAMHARTSGFPLCRHNVFFSADYQAEFEQILTHRRVPADPTVYVCAQDRESPDAPADGDAERLLVLVNAPADGDRRAMPTTEIETCLTNTLARLAACGLTVDHRTEATVATTPAMFAQRYPATGGALYGTAMHGPLAAFRRPSAQTRLPGLFLAGGSVHPGPGVPMAVISGQLAADSVLVDLTSH